MKSSETYSSQLRACTQNRLQLLLPGISRRGHLFLSSLCREFQASSNNGNVVVSSLIDNWMPGSRNPNDPGLQCTSAPRFVKVGCRQLKIGKSKGNVLL